MKEYDLVVIGSGAGLDVANAAAQGGLRVAIVEKGRMGGTCLNRGCIPSKLLLHSADVAEVIKRADLFGIHVEKYTINFKKIVERVNGIIDSDSDGIRDAFKDVQNPKLFEGQCKFVAEKTVLVNDEALRADKFLIASGTRPTIPKIRGLDGSDYITSDEALRLDKQPRVLTIIGGGYIAAELAHFFGSLGTQINIIQHRDVLVPHEDKEVSEVLTRIFSNRYNTYLGYSTESVRKEDGLFYVSATKKSSGKKVEIESDQLLIATGRTPNSDTLDLERTGVKVDKRGFIEVDEYLETSKKGIFALGDAIGRYQFRHSANLEAQYAYNNILNYDKGKIPVNYEAMPHAIFSSPQVAGVGFTEQDLEKNGKIEFEKSVYPYIGTAMGQALEDREGFVKFLVHKKDRKILGCHIIGTDASVLIPEVLVAMRAGDGTIDSITRTVHIHPALSEVVARAASGV